MVAIIEKNEKHWFLSYLFQGEKKLNTLNFDEKDFTFLTKTFLLIIYWQFDTKWNTYTHTITVDYKWEGGGKQYKKKKEIHSHTLTHVRERVNYNN